MEPLVHACIPSHREEQRRDARRVCSVLSQLFAVDGGSRQYLGSGVVLDISDTGLALLLNQPPPDDTPLLIRNIYFEVRGEIRNRTPMGRGTRLGIAFTSAVHWYREQDELPLSSLIPVSPIPLPGSEKWAGDRNRLQCSLLALLKQEHIRTPETSGEFSSDLPGDVHDDFLKYSLNGFCLCEAVPGPDGQPADFIFLEANQLFCELAGVDSVIGKRATELWPDIKHVTCRR